jgi:hypothetical protein
MGIGGGGIEPLDKGSGARDALQKFFRDGNPEHLKKVPTEELEKAKRNFEKAVEKAADQGKDAHKRNMQQRVDRLRDVLKGRAQPKPSIPWWRGINPPIILMPPEILLPIPRPIKINPDGTISGPPSA